MNPILEVRDWRVPTQAQLALAAQVGKRLPDGSITLSGRESGLGITFVMWDGVLSVPNERWAPKDHQGRVKRGHEHFPLYGDPIAINKLKALAAAMIHMKKGNVLDPVVYKAIGKYVAQSSVEGIADLPLHMVGSLRRHIIVSDFTVLNQPRGRNEWRCVAEMKLEVVPGVSFLIGVMQSAVTGDMYAAVPADKNQEGSKFKKLRAWAVNGPIDIDAPLTAWVMAELAGSYETWNNQDEWRSCENCAHRWILPTDDFFGRNPSIADVVNEPSLRMLCMVNMQWIDFDLVRQLHEIERYDGNARAGEYLAMPEGTYMRRERFIRDRLSEQGLGCPFHQTRRQRANDTWHNEPAKKDRQKVRLLGDYFIVHGPGVDIVPAGAVKEGLYIVDAIGQPHLRTMRLDDGTIQNQFVR